VVRKPRKTRKVRKIKKIVRRVRKPRKHTHVHKHKRQYKKRSIRKRYIPLKKYKKRTAYYLTTYYWPHWHNYYTHVHYYPYYNFYWFFYNDYHMHYPYYYNYYFDNHPDVVHFHHSNIIYFKHTNPIVLSLPANTSLVTVAKEQYQITKCEKGPRKMVTVNHRGKKFRFFLGDANDLTNLGCLYFMDQVVSVGPSSYAKRVLKLYQQRKKTVNINGHKMDISPFKNSLFKPINLKFKSLNNNAKVVRFTLSRKNSTWKETKSIVFWHLFNKQVTVSKDVNRILNGLARTSYKPINNVLFLADHLEPHSLYLWKYLLQVYKKLVLRRIVRITYRRIRLFSGFIIHNHRSHFHVHHENI